MPRGKEQLRKRTRFLFRCCIHEENMNVARQPRGKTTSGASVYVGGGRRSSYGHWRRAHRNDLAVDFHLVAFSDPDRPPVAGAEVAAREATHRRDEPRGQTAVPLFHPPSSRGCARRCHNRLHSTGPGGYKRTNRVLTEKGRRQCYTDVSM